MRLELLENVIISQVIFDFMINQSINRNTMIPISLNFNFTGLFCILVRVLKNYWKMGSGQWHMEKRSTLKNDSFVKEYNPVTETGSLSIIVLGASGDLAKKKTFPALFNLFHQVFLNKQESFLSFIVFNVTCFYLFDVFIGFT